MSGGHGYSASAGLEKCGNAFHEVVLYDQRESSLRAPDHPVGINSARGGSAPVKIRTSNLLIRSQMLYPVELRVLKERLICGGTGGRQPRGWGKRRNARY
jgi:hypothetical protein